MILIRTAILGALFGSVAWLAPHATAPNGLVVPNDNRSPAGKLRNGVLDLRLVAQETRWLPDLEAEPIPIYAFAEEGQAARIPGPLIRVRAGTTVRVHLTNALPLSMLVRGLQQRPVATLDSTRLAPGASHTFTFTPTSPGTYYYWGLTGSDATRISQLTDGQLLGALVVDPAEGPVPADRIWVIGLWRAEEDSVQARPGERIAETLTMNGLTWPFTERMTYTVGDTVRYRVINGTRRGHPMHLHGAYFRVDSYGTARADTIYAPADQRMVVTERMSQGTTYTMTYVPSRPGNWLFHCHLAAHVTINRRLIVRDSTYDMHAGDHAQHGMAGVIVAIAVRPASPASASSTPIARKQLRLFVTQRPNVYGARPGYSYIVQEGAEPAADSLQRPSSTLYLTRGEPTEITVFNKTARPATVHWHGLELESYYDGVGDFSGDAARRAPPIAPGDSFVVRVTPERAGTFIYHSHSEEGLMISSGMHGPMIILEPGERPDASRDRVFVLSAGGPAGNALPPVINWQVDPPPVELRVGETMRWRFINITPNDTRRVRLVGEGDVVQRWTLLAKDGATVPAHQATERPADLLLGPGETIDFAFTGRVPGTYVLSAVTPPRGTRMQVIVRP